MRVRKVFLSIVAAISASAAARACPPSPAPGPVPAVNIAAPAAQAFAQAGTVPGVQLVPAPLVQQVLVPQPCSTLAVAGQSATVLPVAVVSSSSRCRTGLLADLRLARRAGRAARKAVLSSRCQGSTAVSQAIAIQRN